MNEPTAFDLIMGSLFSVLVAVLATLGRIGHEVAHGARVPFSHILWLLPLGITFGIIGHAAGEFITQWQSLHNPYIGPALAGGLGLLGPVYFSRIAEIALSWIQKDKDDGKH